ncbi:hypothetical protein COT42_00840 [Candidatus Saganbacteria bacterium CG08_land_8_20_14_0_20_45_16]|uniref:Uncharacterized protein n=1 Tax=Candidatus Saganbacteria bacterium CG08_land_8_20_14_0_20_45_16 TaxID=2014293 RepID=A0A2H0Y3N4_UNCSA|nr:MAG: hypothetical protein COT42_00840 [Candidatus Saganbacteria bacterium CG08_land_8_20_14_0_20_45_16]
MKQARAPKASLFKSLLDQEMGTQAKQVELITLLLLVVVILVVLWLWQWRLELHADTGIIHLNVFELLLNKN